MFLCDFSFRPCVYFRQRSSFCDRGGGKIEVSNQAQGTCEQKVRLYLGILKPGLLQSQPHLVCRHQHILSQLHFRNISNYKATTKNFLRQLVL